MIHDVAGRLETLHIWASFDGSEDWEPVALGGDLDEREVMGGTSRELIAGIYLFTVRRMGGWPSRSVILEDYGIALDGTPVAGNDGPAVAFSPADGTEDVARTSDLVVTVTAGTYALVEESIAIWLSFDGGARWEVAVKHGELVSVYDEAGSTKVGTVYTLRRFGGLYSALRARTLMVRVAANDEHGLVARENMGDPVAPVVASYTLAPVVLALVRRDATESALGRTTLWEDTNVISHDKDYLVIEGPDALEQRIRHRLITRTGSWALHPEYGAGLEDILFDIDRPGTIEEVERRVRDQLSYEAEVAKVIQVSVTAEDSADGQIMRVVVEYETINADAGEAEVAFRRAA